MNYFKENDHVVYVGCSQEQINWGSNDDPRKILIQGDVYIIERIEVKSQHTKLTLKEISGRFNSVCFEKL
jgi:hypothetical protein